MDAFHFGNLKAEKASALSRNNLLTGIGKTLRIVELSVALVLISWLLTLLPFAVNVSVDYVRKLSCLIGSPLFVFMIANAIIFTLVVKSGRITGQNSDSDNADAELYEEFLKNSSDRSKSLSEADALLSRVAEEVEYQDKQIISVSEMNATDRSLQDQAAIDTRTDTDSDAGVGSDLPTIYRRMQSEKLNEERRKTVQRKFRRSKTEKCQENWKSGKNPWENLYSHDNLSNEEFQRMIEAFIAKQMRFLREESLDIVVQDQNQMI